MAEVATADTIVKIRPRKGWVPIDLKEIWRYRELIGFLAMRDVKVLYKQSILGAAWVVAQPVMTMVVFNVLFGLLLGKGGKPTMEGVPYAVSTYCALVPWQYFSKSLTSSGNSLINNQHLITKVYFPRMVAPLASITAPLVDFGVAFLVLILMMVWYGVVPGWQVVFVPVFIAFAAMTSLAISLWAAALNAIYRDVRHVLPFLVQTLMYVSPVIYTTDSIMGNQPGWVRTLYGLNPMAGVIEGFRWSLLDGAQPPWILMSVSFFVVLVILVGGMFYFRRLERTFADVV